MFCNGTYIGRSENDDVFNKIKVTEALSTSSRVDKYYLSRHAIVCAFVSIYSNSSGLDNYLNRLSIGTINNHIANIPGCFSCSEISFQAILFFTLSMYFGCCRLYKNSYLRTHSISFSSSILVYECLSSGTSNEWLWGEASRQ